MKIKLVEPRKKKKKKKKHYKDKSHVKKQPKIECY